MVSSNVKFLLLNGNIGKAYNVHNHDRRNFCQFFKIWGLARAQSKLANAYYVFSALKNFIAQLYDFVQSVALSATDHRIRGGSGTRLVTYSPRQ